VEASAVHHPAALGRLPITAPLLRLRSDEQLVAHFRAGNDDAFGVLHDRYRQRLFAYVRQMLSSAPRQDAEDVLQDVFVRAYGALRADRREMNVRAWLYRVAHNRCIDQMRRPAPPPAELFEVSRKPLHDPVEEAQRREDLARLVQDIARLPEQQRSALLMREIDGMSYAHLAAALDVTVPAVKSLLVRARVGLVEAAEARDADCVEIREELVSAYDRGVKAPGRARKHMRNCAPCSEYRTALRGVQRSFAALSPIALGPAALTAKLLGLGGASGGAAAGGTAAAGGSAAGGALAGGGIATATACKVAAVVCTAAITAGGAVEAQHIVRQHQQPPPARIAAPAAAPAVTRAAPATTVRERPLLPHGAPAIAPERPAPATDAPATTPTGAVGTELPAGSGAVPGGSAQPADAPGAGGTRAPDEPETATPAATDPTPSTAGSGTASPGTATGTPGTTAPGDVPASDPPVAAPSGGAEPAGTTPPPTH
jgi:RNA polymerase sigma factor (sigma-70 family)